MSTQTAYFEDGTLDEFDSTTPAWDKEVNIPTDFDTKVDTGSHMWATGIGTHDGAIGIGVGFPDTSAAYGTMNADAVDQTSGVVSFWFNKDNWDLLSAGNLAVIAGAYGGGGAGYWYLAVKNDGGTLKYLLQYYTDAGGGGTTATATEAVGAGWEKITVMRKRSTGAGNNNGYMYFFVNDILIDVTTGVDDDTLDWDYMRAGMIFTNSTTFGGSFYIDTLKIDPVGAPMVDRLAAYTGTYGMAIPVMDTNQRYGSFTDPTSETSVTIEYGFDPNTLTMAAADEFWISAGYGAGGVFWQSIGILYYTGSAYQIYLSSWDDSSTEHKTAKYTITDAPHKIRTVWQASSGAGADDGFNKLYIDDVLMESITGLDNDTLTINTVYYGAVATLDVGTYGIFYMDDCKIEFPIVKTLTIKDNDGNTLGSIEPTDATILFSNKDKWFAYDLTTLT